MALAAVAGGRLGAGGHAEQADDEKNLEKWKGKLKGRIVLAFPTREVKAPFDPLASRFNDTDLKKLEEVDPTASPRRNYNRALFAFMPKRLQFLMDEGVTAVLEPSRSGDGGTVFVNRAVSTTPRRRRPTSVIPRRCRHRWSSPSSTTTGLRACSRRTCRSRSS